MRIVTLVENTCGAENCIAEHGLRIYIETEKHKLLLLSGCAHNGILNILDRYKELFLGYPDYVITGLYRYAISYTLYSLSKYLKRKTVQKLLDKAVHSWTVFL